MAEDILKEDDDIVEGQEQPEKVEIELTEEEAKSLPVEESEPEQQDAVAKAGDDDEDERESIRERRRLEKKERKERRERAINRDKIELEFLRKRNDELERRVVGVEQKAQQNDLSLIEQKLKEAINEVQLAEKVIAKAVAAGNGEDVTQALRYRDQAMAKARQFEVAKKASQQPKAPEAPPPVDEETMRHARQFIQEHSWYDPSGKDEDSAIVLAIDNALMREGFNPKSDDYWDELRDRVRRRLPERFDDSDDDAEPAPKAGQKSKAAAPAKERTARGGPPVGSGREHAPTSTRREIYVSPERKAALIEAGVWDDPVLRNKYIKKYMEYDRSNRS